MNRRTLSFLLTGAFACSAVFVDNVRAEKSVKELKQRFSQVNTSSKQKDDAKKPGKIDLSKFNQTSKNNSVIAPKNATNKPGKLKINENFLNTKQKSVTSNDVKHAQNEQNLFMDNKRIKNR